MMKTSSFWLCAGLGAAAALAGCAGGGSDQSMVPTRTASSTSLSATDRDARGAKVRFKIVIRKHRGRAKHHGDYISASTKSVSIVAGNAAPVVAGLTPGSPGCSSTMPLTCTVQMVVAPGRQTFTVTLFDGLRGTGNQLSVGTATATIAAGQVNLVNVVCNGVVASLALSLNQPAPAKGVAQTIPLAVSALDADGNTIVAPGTYENGPVTVTDSDTTYTQLQNGTGTPGSSATVTGPADVVNVLYDGNTHLASATFSAAISSAPSIATATATMTPVTAQIAIDAGTAGTAISQDMIGGNLPAWTDNTNAQQGTAMQAGGLHLVRWPGGSLADEYHWESPTASPCNGGYAYGPSSFDAMMTNVAQPANLDVAITLNYGSNAACNAGGDPLEANAWVAYSKSKGYDVKYWTVGNENYGSWETDYHALPNDPTTYAAAVSTPTTGYYDEIKAADPNAKVGIVVGGPAYFGTWDTTVLPAAAGHFDFVEYHYYAQQGVSAGAGAGDAESDTYLLDQGVTDFAKSLTDLRTEMTTAGAPTSIPIYLGELNSIVGTAGKQTTSITNALFAGMAMGEAIKSTAGLGMASWWLAFGDCETAASGGNFAASLYGWQNFGAYTLYSDQSTGCGTENTVPYGTAFPDGVAYELLSQFVGPGSSNRNVTTSLSTANARVYADTLGSGYGVLLFNLSETATATYTVALANTPVTQFAATQTSYDKAQYDLTNQAQPVWSGPSVPLSLGTVGRSFSVTLQPWSMNLVELVPVTPASRRPPVHPAH